jgi:RNA polymerase sigma-70 factor (ECF subfamily)
VVKEFGGWLRCRGMITRMTGAGGASSEIDPLVVKRAIWGDRLAFEGLLRHYDSRLRAFAYRLVGDEVDDVLQEAYVRAYRSLHTFEERGLGISPWMHRIVYNAAVDLLRQRTTRRAIVSRVEQVVPRYAGSAESEVLEVAGLAELLEMLPIDLRAVALLVDGYGFSYDDAADILGVPAGTVASRLHRARDTLRTSHEFRRGNGDQS